MTISVMSAVKGADLASWPGTTAIDTPVPVIDLAIAERNMQKLQDICQRAGVANWPHVKTHKSVQIMRRQLAAGAVGIVCQKVGEAEVMADGGAASILISYNILGAHKLNRLRALAERVCLTVACDNEFVAMGLSEFFAGATTPLEVLVEIDRGRGRRSVVEARAAADLALRVASLPGLACVGLMAYPPEGPMEGTRNFIAATVRRWAEGGLALPGISSGGTPNLRRISEMGATEYRSGTSIYNDRQMVAVGTASLADCALHVRATVVSHPTGDRLILDAGSKSLTSELAGLEDHGLLVDYPEARIYKLAEEHGFVDVSGCRTIPVIGEIVRILPNHVCPVVNMFDRMLCRFESGHLERLVISARGRVS